MDKELEDMIDAIGEHVLKVPDDRTMLEFMAEQEMNAVVDIARKGSVSDSVLIPATVVAIYGIRISAKDDTMLQTGRCTAIPSDGNLPKDRGEIVKQFSNMGNALYGATGTMPQIIFIISDAYTAEVRGDGSSKEDALKNAMEAVEKSDGVRGMENSRECIIVTAVGRNAKCVCAMKEYARSVSGETAGQIVFGETKMSPVSKIEDELNASKLVFAASVMFAQVTETMCKEVKAIHPDLSEKDTIELVQNIVKERDIHMSSTTTPSMMMLDAASGGLQKFE